MEYVKKFFGAGNLKSEKLVSDRHKFIWIGVPKAAMTSILSVLHQDQSEDFGTVLIYDEFWKILERGGYDDYFKFAFVRNPWSRVVSSYLNKVVKGGARDRNYLDDYPGLDHDITFEEFVRYLTVKQGRFDMLSDRHWISQHRFISDRKGRVRADYVGKLETIDDDFKKACAIIGIKNLPLPEYNTRFDWGLISENSSTRDQDYYRSYYTPATRDAIGKRYRKDIELFGYEF